MRRLLQGPATVEAAAGMASLLPQHPSNCRKALSHALPALLLKINVCVRLTLIAATKASGPLRQAPVILQRLPRGFFPLWSMRQNVHNQSSVILRPGSGRMKPVLLLPGPHWLLS